MTAVEDLANLCLPYHLGGLGRLVPLWQLGWLKIRAPLPLGSKRPNYTQQAVASKVWTLIRTLRLLSCVFAVFLGLVDIFALRVLWFLVLVAGGPVFWGFRLSWRVWLLRPSVSGLGFRAWEAFRCLIPDVAIWGVGASAAWIFGIV